MQSDPIGHEAVGPPGRHLVLCLNVFNLGHTARMVSLPDGRGKGVWLEKSEFDILIREDMLRIDEDLRRTFNRAFVHSLIQARNRYAGN